MTQTPPNRYEWMDVWFQYAKDRYLQAESQRSESRASCRQLAAAVVVQIGLAFAIGKTLMDAGSFLPPWLVLVSVFGVFVIVLIQLLHAGRTTIEGYAPAEHPRPQSPTAIFAAVEYRDKREALRVIGIQYANAADGLEAHNKEYLAKLRSMGKEAGAIILALYVLLVMIMFGVTWAPPPRAHAPASTSSTPARQP